MEEADPQQELKSQAQIFNHIYSFVNSHVLKCAIELGIFDTIHGSKGGKPMTLSTLATTIPLNSINTRNLHRLMVYLVHMGLLQKNVTLEEDEFSLTQLGEFLVKDGEKSLVNWALAIINEAVGMGCWHHLSRCCSLESGGPTLLEEMHGMSAWEYVGKNPEVNRLINDAMASDTKLVMPAFIQGCGHVLEGIGSLVDLGGGTGMAMNMVAEAFPHLKCTVFDLPHVVETAPAYPNVSFVGGDMFEFVPNADAILLKFMLHNWQDDGCIKILKKCKDAIPKVGGKVMIVEIILDLEDDDEDLIRSKHSLDLDMMVATGGKERTEEEWKVLINSAGFSGLEIVPIMAIQSVIMAYP
ncbi:scoulerine-9-O-methyltransferase 2-like [Magnolia sinica]|uniref:scoulerine-9-O-methyltransferase 2-like n=1 Tax=Magnolia sinica TaxID=86752 RepID=UPI00265AE5AF|nr:scoulerine-9-O-methyltransferase 2-like [Magnolia sinica]